MKFIYLASGIHKRELLCGFHLIKKKWINRRKRTWYKADPIAYKAGKNTVIKLGVNGHGKG